MRTSLIALSLVLAACGGGELGDGPTTTVPTEDVTTTTTVDEAGWVSAYFLHDTGGNKGVSDLSSRRLCGLTPA